MFIEGETPGEDREAIKVKLHVVKFSCMKSFYSAGKKVERDNGQETYMMSFYDLSQTLVLPYLI
jgi:hypothetical protein